MGVWQYGEDICLSRYPRAVFCFEDLQNQKEKSYLHYTVS